MGTGAEPANGPGVCPGVVRGLLGEEITFDPGSGAALCCLKGSKQAVRWPVP